MVFSCERNGTIKVDKSSFRYEIFLVSSDVHKRPTFPNANKYLELTGDLADGGIVRDSNYHQEF